MRFSFRAPFHFRASAARLKGARERKRPKWHFNEITDNLTFDPFGAVGAATDPLYQVIVNFTAGNAVAGNQSQRYVLQYLVTDNNSGAQIVQVDNNIVGGAFVRFGASGGLTAKSLCHGAPFGSSVGTPTGACSGTLYASVAPNGGSQFLGNPDSEADSSIVFNGPSQKFGGSTGSSNFGVYDQAPISAAAPQTLWDRRTSPTSKMIFSNRRFRALQRPSRRGFSVALLRSAGWR